MGMSVTIPAHTTGEMWAFWLAFRQLEPSVKLGGTYAPKPGYHNYRDALPTSDYSAQSELDRQGPGDVCAAIDLVFPDARRGDYRTIKRYSARLLSSGRDPGDERGDYLREFFGQSDDDQGVEGWDFQAAEPSSSDTSHLWHIHLSFVRAHVADPGAYRAVLSILRGESVASWQASAAGVGEDMAVYYGRVKDGPKAGALFASLGGVVLSWYATQDACRAAVEAAGRTWGLWDCEPTGAELDAGRWGTPLAPYTGPSSGVSEIRAREIAREEIGGATLEPGAV